VKAGEGERRDEDLIFCDSVGNLLSKGSCKWPLWRACGKAGLRKIGWHTARHYADSGIMSRRRVGDRGVASGGRFLEIESA
jgi:hypothetical protein